MEAASPEPAQAYLQLRQRLLNFEPAELGLTPSLALPHVWGVIMETGYDAGTATLVCLADGTTSLYYSTGGGMIGSSRYTPVADASKAWVAEAEHHIDQLPVATQFPLPGVGEVRFYFLTYGGVLLASSSESELSVDNQPLTPLYQRAQDILSRLRLLSQKKRG